MSKKILIVDDDLAVCESIKMMLDKQCEVAYVCDVASAKDYINQNNIDLIILDYNIGEDSGITFYEEEIHAKNKKIPGVLISGFIVTQLKSEEEMDGLNQLFVRIFEKPFDFIEFRKYILSLV
jgi:DNA-binding response OmpR family regulator